MKISETLNAARLRAGAILRERRERAAEKKAARRIVDPPGVTVFEWQVRTAHILSWGAWAIAAFFFWSYCIGTAGDQASALHLSRIGTWSGNLQFFFPLIIGFAGLSLAIPYLAKSIIPIFVVFSWRTHFWPKLACLVLVLGASFALIASSFSVMGGAIIEHGRGAAVATEQVQNQRGALQAQIEGEQTDLRDMMNNRNAYMAQAANVGAAAWESTYIAQARRTNDPRLPMIERALGAAQAADARRAHIAELRGQLGAAATVAAVEGTPVTADTAQIADSMALVRLSWPIIMSVLNDIVCLFLGWIAYHLEKIRSMQLGMVAGIPQHPWMLEDKQAGRITPDAVDKRSAQDVVDAMVAGGADPRFAADMARSALRSANKQEEMYDAQTGERLHYRKGTWAKPPKRKGRGAKDVDAAGEMAFEPPVLPDDVGVPPERDGRDAELRSSMHQPVEEWSVPHGPDLTSPEPEADQQAPRAEQGEEPKSEQQEAVQDVHNDGVQTEPPEPDFTDEALQSINALAPEQPEGVVAEAEAPDAAPDPEATEEQHEPKGEADPVHHDTTEPAREPETDPARLIAAE